MDLYSIVILVVLALSIGLVLKLIKGVIKIIGFIFLILSIASIVFGFFVYQDVTDLMQNLPNSNNIFLLGNDKVYAGMITVAGEEEPSFIDNLEDYQVPYQNKNYEVLRGSNYKLFIFKIELFERTDEKIDMGGMRLDNKDISLSKSEVLDIIESDDGVEELASILVSKGQLSSGEKQAFKNAITEDIGSGNALKGVMFAMLFSEVGDNPMLVLMTNLGSGKTMIYPETIVFKLFKIIPMSLMEGIIQKAMGGIGEAIPQ